MVNLALDALIQETAIYIGEEIGAAPYTGDIAKVTAKVTSGLNYAYMHISEKKWKLFMKQTVVLATGAIIDTTALTKTFLEVRHLRDAYDNDLEYEFTTSTDIEVTDKVAGDSVVISYYYSPPEMSALTDKVAQPNGAFNNKILCFYAAYQYLQIDNDDTAPYWLNLYNAGFDSITQKHEMGW